MRVRRWFAGIGLVTASLGLAASGPVTGQRRPLPMLDNLLDGRWELRIRGERSVQRLCLRDGRGLIQLRHTDLACDKTIVEDTLESVTVQYTCRGQGYGRTHIRKETAALVQVESQGVAGGLPFEFAAEGRRVGDCPS